jgi:uncharacterized membrane protein
VTAYSGIPGTAIDPGISAEPILKDDSPSQEPVWTYRGYRIRSDEFNTAMIHFYRGEISRANVWRQRLDATTNWAVVTTGAAISFAFNQSLGQHSIILLNALLITLFLFIEARRYMYYELWSYRIRLMETDFFAAMLVPPFQPGSDWAESLAENLLQPDFPISVWEALGRRFRRNYVWIFTILILAWIMRVGFLPEPVKVFAEFISRAAIGNIPGQIVIAGLAFFYLVLLLFGLVTLGLHNATGEVLPHFAGLGMPHIHSPEGGKKHARAWFRASGRRKQLLATIITDAHEQVAKQILHVMQRGVTSLSGKGLYTGKDHPVLMCALTVTEVKQLKTLVSQTDPHAFIIVTPAHEVLGNGFKPLEEES